MNGLGNLIFLLASKSFQIALKSTKCDISVVERVIFSQNIKKSPSDRGFAPRPPSI